jgi:hypothetical protein
MGGNIMDKGSIKRLEDFKEYFCRNRCQFNGVKCIEDEDIKYDVFVNYVDCVCPDCGKSFKEYDVDDCDIDYDVDEYFDVPSNYCDVCQVNLFVEQLKYELR